MTTSARVFFPLSLLAALDWLSLSRPRVETSTSQRHPRKIFRRALEHDNLVLAGVTAREIGRVTIAEALELTALVAPKPLDRYGRFAAPGFASGSRNTSRQRSSMSSDSSRICDLSPHEKTTRGAGDSEEGRKAGLASTSVSVLRSAIWNHDVPAVSKSSPRNRPVPRARLGAGASAA